MSLKFCVVGKTKEEFYRASENEYLNRIRKYVPMQYEILPSSSGQSNPELCRKTEEAALMKQMNPGNFVVLLDEKGEQYNSLGFSEQLNKWMNHRSDIVFMVGGAFGVSAAVRERADFIMSLSKMTMPHHLVRTVFLEQLYRAFSILKGEKYHNEG